MDLLRLCKPTWRAPVFAEPDHSWKMYDGSVRAILAPNATKLIPTGTRAARRKARGQFVSFHLLPATECPKLFDLPGTRRVSPFTVESPGLPVAYTIGMGFRGLPLFLLCAAAVLRAQTPCPATPLYSHCDIV